MPKKTAENATKPLPLVLTVGSTTEASPATPAKRRRKASTQTTRQPASPTIVAPSTAPTVAGLQCPQPVATAEQARTPVPALTVRASFMLYEPHATRVALCGEFNAWSTAATPMTRQADGRWQTTVALSPGRYQYKFVVDGQWLPDPNGHELVANDFGSFNSVVEVRA